MSYNFYFDETYHDRKITIKSDGQVNIFKDEQKDTYMGVFWGCKCEDEKKITDELNILEKKYEERYGLSNEFKSTVIKKKNFTYGIKSFTKNAFDYYSDLFQLLGKSNLTIHVNILSKMELLVRNIMRPSILLQKPFVNHKLFYYSMTKFMLVYHSPKLIEALYSASEEADGEIFQKELLNHLKIVIRELGGIVRKEREIPALEQLYDIVSELNFGNDVHKKYDFVYFQNFEGLARLLDEKNIPISEVNLVIDNEEKSYNAAKMYPFAKVTKSDSMNSIQIRLADQLCGFCGKMMTALTEDNLLKEDPVNDINLLQDNDLERKRLLSLEWFDIQPHHFELYKTVFNVLIVQQEAYWATMTWSYADQASMFYCLLKYFASFESYEKYKEISLEMHSEYYNSFCCEDIQRHFVEMS